MMLLLVLSLLASPHAAQTGGSLENGGRESTWPEIEELNVEQVFLRQDEEEADTPLVAIIRNPRGEGIYRIECHNWAYDDDSLISYSGSFQCGLFAYEGGMLVPSNLLAADTEDELSTDWWNRGRILRKHLRGECLKYPEYSSTRNFRLRNMRVTLRFFDVEWSEKTSVDGLPRLKSFSAALSAKRDATADSSRAEVPVGDLPPKSCYP